MITVFSNGINMLNKGWNFPSGEYGCRIEWGAPLGSDGCDDHVSITLRYEDDAELIRLAMICDAIRREYGSGVDIRLNMPYVPYSRQDRVMCTGESLSVAVVAKFINGLGFSQVVVEDPHSDVTTALFDNVLVYDQSMLMRRFGHAIRKKLGDYMIVSPDAGALKKIYKCAAVLGVNDIIYASKIRNVDTGTIKETRIDYSTVDFKGTENLLIIDDIADGMGTFLALAEQLKKKTTGKVALYVTHGFFTKGVDIAHGLLDNIFVANDYRTDKTDTYNIVA